jgi:hypothetical protein
VEEWRATYPTIPIDLIHFHKDSRYHGRLHAAYMMSTARYISIWDDDLLVGPKWLEYVVSFISSHEDKVIVSSGGRNITSIPDVRNQFDLEYDTSPNPKGRARYEARPVDFTVQNHSLRRELLRHYLASPVYTYATGEDIQLNFALQRHGIQAYKLPPRGKWSNAYADADSGALGSEGKFASWKTNPQEPRKWLLCKVIEQGFRTQTCTNCDTVTVRHCLDHFESLNSTSLIQPAGIN